MRSSARNDERGTGIAIRNLDAPGGRTVLMARSFYRAHHRALLISGSIVAGLVIAIFILSYLIDPVIRARTEAVMNQKLVGYHTHLARAHLQLLTGTLTLYGLTIVQNAHPKPPVADIKEIEAQVDLDALLFGRVTAQFTVDQPRIHINLLQLKTEASNKVPVKKQGWQDAVEAIYPFKINRLIVNDGSFTYIDTDSKNPLELTRLHIVASNIRNVRSPRAAYPSPIHLDTQVFKEGKLILDGHANFLAEPFAGVQTQYWAARLPLSRFEPELEHANLHVSGGVLDSRGVVEYSPQVRRFEVYNATIEGINLEYIHEAQTEAAERKRAEEVKAAAKRANNQPGLLLKVDDIEIRDGRLAYTDRAKNPPYQLYLSQANLELSDFSNQAAQGESSLKASGKFMGSGDTRLTGGFRAEPAGPDFNVNLAIQHTNLVALNDLLEAYGRLRVAQGDFSLYTQMASKGGEVNGYVKPFFSNLKVYDYQKDKNKPLLQQAYKMAVGAIAVIFKNHSTDKVATQVDISGNLNQPNVSTWQAIGQLVENAFIKAILPGFDREVKATSADHVR